MSRASASACAGARRAPLPLAADPPPLPHRLAAFSPDHGAEIACRLSHHEGGFPSLTFSSGALTMTPASRRTTPLRQRMIEDMKLRNLSPHTVQAYVDRVAAFAKHFGRSPRLLGPEEVRAYLV